MNILDPFRCFLFTQLDFCAFSVDKCNATVKTISSKMEAISWLPLTLASKMAVYLKNIQNSHRHDNSYQSEFLFIHDNVYNDYRTVFYHLLHEWMKI